MSSILNHPSLIGFRQIHAELLRSGPTEDLAKENLEAFEMYAESQTVRAHFDGLVVTGRNGQQDQELLPPTYRPQYTPDLNAMLFKDNKLIGVVYGDGDADFRSDDYENSVTGNGTDWLELAKKAAYDLGVELMVKTSAQPVDITS